MDSSSTPPSSHLHVAFKVIQLVNRLRNHLKPRVQTTKPQNYEFDGRFCGEFARNASKEINSFLSRKDINPSGRRARKAHHRVFKSHPEEFCRWQDKPASQAPVTNLDNAKNPVAALLHTIDDLGYRGPSLCQVAVDDKLFIQRKTGLRLDHLTFLDIARALATVDELLQIIRNLLGKNTSLDYGKLICDGHELGFPEPLDEKFLANLEHLLLGLRYELVQACTRKAYEMLRKDALHWQKLWKGQRMLGRDRWCSEFADNHRPISTTWPWSIRPSLAVLWGVCWMFYDRHPGDSSNEHPGKIQSVPHQPLFTNVLYPLSTFPPFQPSARRHPHYSSIERCSSVGESRNGVRDVIQQEHNEFPDVDFSELALQQMQTDPEFFQLFHTTSIAFDEDVGSSSDASASAVPRTTQPPPSPAQARRRLIQASPPDLSCAYDSKLGNITSQGDYAHAGGLFDDGQYNGDASSVHACSCSTGCPIGSAAPTLSEWPQVCGDACLTFPNTLCFHKDFSQQQQQQEQQLNSVPIELDTEPISPLWLRSGDSDVGRVTENYLDSTPPRSDHVASCAHDTHPKPGIYAVDSRSYPKAQNLRISDPGMMGNRPYPSDMSKEQSANGRRLSNSSKSSDMPPSEAESLVTAPDPIPGVRSNTLKRPEDPPKDKDGNMICERPECKHLKFQRKCEWGKHMDKHERPYKCKEPGCEKLPGFTYSGGLLRHQREVHKIGATRKNSLFCDQPNCKRGPGGEGFTRKENLAEHKRRVHQRPSTEASSPVTKVREETVETQSPAPDEEDAAEVQQRTPTKRKRESAWRGINEVEEEDIKEEIKRLKREHEDTKRALQEELREKDERIRKLEDAFAEFTRSR